MDRGLVRPALPLSRIWPAPSLDNGLLWRPCGRIDLDLSHPYFVEDGDGLRRIAKATLLLTPRGRQSDPLTMARRPVTKKRPPEATTLTVRKPPV